LKGEISVEVLEFHTLRPFDKEALLNSAGKTGQVVTVEDHVIWGGLGSTVAEVLCEEMPTKLKRVGLRDYAATGKYMELVEAFDIGPTAIEAAVRSAASQ